MTFVIYDKIQAHYDLVKKSDNGWTATDSEQEAQFQWLFNWNYGGRK